MIDLATLTLPTAGYDALTYPKYRSLLGGDADVVAVSATDQGQPIGLGLARVGAADRTGEVLSIAVSPGYRGRGIGTALLDRVEQDMGKTASVAQAVYMGNTPSAEAVKRILEKRGWGPIRPRMLVCRSNLECIFRAPWMHRSYLSPDYEIFPWCKLTPEEERDVREQRHYAYERCFSPFVDDVEVECGSSLGLRYRGQVVGWMINHIVSPDTLRLTRMFVRPDLQRRGRGVSLLIESLTRYQHQPASGRASNGIFDIHVENRPMMEFAKRRLAPYMIDMYFSYGATKILQAG